MVAYVDEGNRDHERAPAEQSATPKPSTRVVSRHPVDVIVVYLRPLRLSWASPDDGDALALTFARSVAPVTLQKQFGPVHPPRLDGRTRRLGDSLNASPMPPLHPDYDPSWRGQNFGWPATFSGATRHSC